MFVNILLIIILRGLFIRHRIAIKNSEVLCKNLSIKYDTALSYIDQLPDLYDRDYTKFSDCTVTTLSNDTVGNLTSFIHDNRLFLYVSKKHCQKCVDFVLSTIPDMNKIIGSERLIVLCDDLNNKNIYLWQKENGIDNLFLDLKSENETGITMPLLFSLTKNCEIKYPYMPEKLFDRSLMSYLYIIKDLFDNGAGY